MNTATQAFVNEHAGDDVRQLALRRVPADVDLRAALQQIEGRQIAARKLPLWAATDGLLFPPRLNLEQCSSEATATYKRSVVARHMDRRDATFVDLTAGFGVDFAAIASLFTRAVYVDCNADLCELARHNLPLLGLSAAEVRCTMAEEALEDLSSSAEAPAPVDVIMIDPARRDSAGRKVSLIENCVPDVCHLQEQLCRAARLVVVKLSPMLDLTAAIRALHGVVEVHVVSVAGECKELLLLLRQAAHIPVDEIPITCVDLTPSGLVSCIYDFTRSDEAVAPLMLADDVAGYLYEPNASILKSGAYKTICQRFPVRKLSMHAHLYTSDTLLTSFPGRTWRVVQQSSFAKRSLRELLNGATSADITVRGFPLTAVALRRQLQLREGGDIHLVATTLSDGQRCLLKVERVSQS